MQKLILHLPKYRLSVSYRLTKRRKTPVAESLIPSKKVLNLKYRVGGPIQKLFRHIFEHKAIKRLLGTNIAFMLVASSFIPNLSASEPKVLSASAETTQQVLKFDIPIDTTVSIQNPVAEIKITQGYKFFHPGLDLDGVTGDLIKPIKAGIVTYANTETFGYGKHIIINHGDEFTTLYAHLSKINVKVGDFVDTNTVIGEMGSTGHSTGSHLHFETRQKGIPVNPLTLLPK